jgi:hypothetical protein
VTNPLKRTALHPERANASEIIKRIFPEGKQFPPSMKKGKAKDPLGREVVIGVPDGIIARLTRECRGNVPDRHVVAVISRSFEEETNMPNGRRITIPHSGAYDNDPPFAAKNATDLETGSYFGSAYRGREEDIAHTRNNWVCYDFKDRRIVPTPYAIGTMKNGAGGFHLKSWFVEMSAGGEN